MARISDRYMRGKEVAAGRRRYFIALSSMTAAVLIACIPFVDAVPVLLGMIALSIGCIATNTSQVFALTNDLLPNPRDIGKVMSFEVTGANVIGFMSPIVTGYLIALTGSFNAAFVTAGLMMLVGMSSALFVANRPMIVPPRPATIAAGAGD